MSLKSSVRVEPNVFELEIAIDAEEFKAALLKVFNKKRNSILIPGFRKGKAPLSLIEKTYGKSVFYDDAVEMLFPSIMAQAYKEGEIKAVDNPYDFDMKEIGEDGVLFTVKVVVKPEVTLAIYKGLQGEKGDTQVSQSEIDAEINRLRERNSRTITVEDRPAQNGDITIIDFEGFVDGVAFDGGKGENYTLTLGSGSFIPGFEDQIIGHSLNDEFEVNVTFPDEYAPELAGKAAVFKVKLHEIKVKELPEADDDFAKEVGEYETAEDMKKGIEEEIGTRKKEESEKAFEEQILDALANHTMADIPEVMFTKKAKENTESFTQRLAQQGADLDTYLMYIGTDRETFDAQMIDGAKKQVALELALEKIGELEGLTADEEDVAAEYQKLADTYGVEVERIKAVFPEESIRQDIVNRKAVEFVIAHAIIVPSMNYDGVAETVKPEKPAKKPAAKKKAAVKKDAE